MRLFSFLTLILFISFTACKSENNNNKNNKTKVEAKKTQKKKANAQKSVYKLNIKMFEKLATEIGVKKNSLVAVRKILHNANKDKLKKDFKLSALDRKKLASHGLKVGQMKQLKKAYLRAYKAKKK